VTEQYGPIHNQVVELLSAYIDDEVTAEERTMVEQHLTMCSACVQNLATLRQAVALLKELPQIAVPRPFTLRQADVSPARRVRMPWWRLSWAQGLLAGAAMLLCVAAVGGILIFNRSARLPQSVALQAPAAPQATDLEKPAAAAASKAVEKTEIMAEKEEIQPAAAATTTEKTSSDFGIQQATSAEAPATAPTRVAEEVPQPEAPLQEAAGAEAEGRANERGAAAADEAASERESTPTQPMAGTAAMPSVTSQPAPKILAGAPTPTVVSTPGQPMAGAAAMPSGTPQPEVHAFASTPTPTLMEVQDLNLEIKPGLIQVSGHLPLPEGRRLHAELWRNKQPTDWAIPESQRTIVQAGGRFSLQLRARPEQPNYNLFDAPPADYEIRLRPVDPSASVEARISFDTYGPPPAGPTNSP
jgi:hypothetical protein